MKQRSVGLALLFSIITCGIYAIYCFIVTTDEVKAVSGRYLTSGIMAFLFNLITCGLYGIYWGYKMGEALEDARMSRGQPMGSFPILFLILNLFGLQIITLAIIQGELNRYTPTMYY